MFFFPNQEEGEGTYTNKQKTRTITMNAHSCKFILPTDWSLDAVHPDALALATILIIYPFSRKKIHLPIGISPYFAQICRDILKKEVTPINPHLARRIPSPDAKLALAYSGGVDSTVAMSLIPNDSALFFTDRIIPKSTPTLYQKESAYYACETLKKEGRKVYVTPTDFEYVRNPVGFPVDLSCGLPAILLSDYESIDSLAMGMILEAAYGIEHGLFKDYPRTWHYKVWGKVFEAVSLTLSLVTAGLSEVANLSIMSQSKYASIAQSCMRAVHRKPCMRCQKCIRKVMLNQTVKRQPLDEALLRYFFTLDIAPKFFASSDMNLQNAMIYITSHYHGNYEPMNVFKHRVAGDIMNVDWLERWYPHSIEVIADKYKDFVRTQILQHVGQMSPEECKQLEAWDLRSFIESEDYKATTIKLFNLISALK